MRDACAVCLCSLQTESNVWRIRYHRANVEANIYTQTRYADHRVRVSHLFPEGNQAPSLI